MENWWTKKKNKKGTDDVGTIETKYELTGIVEAQNEKTFLDFKIIKPQII